MAKKYSRRRRSRRPRRRGIRKRSKFSRTSRYDSVTYRKCHVEIPVNFDTAVGYGQARVFWARDSAPTNPKDVSPALAPEFVHYMGMYQQWAPVGVKMHFHPRLVRGSGFLLALDDIMWASNTQDQDGLAYMVPA